MNVIVINKNFTRTIAGSFTVLGNRQYQSGRVFGFDTAGPNITSRSGITSISGNQFRYSIPPLSVYHLVLSTASAAVEEEPIALSHFRLEQNYPNPFNPTTVVGYQLPAVSKVRLVVYDLLGHEVSTLVNEVKQPGTYSVQFNASSLSSGVYFYRLHAGDYVATKRLVLVR
jgi:hypothetical protein